MKKLFFTTLFLMFFAFSGMAQTGFAPLGAEWYFNEFDPWSQYPNYSRFYVSDDTVVQGHLCSVINTQFIETGHNGIELVYEENNKVYWYNQTSNSFTTLYDFSAEEGASLSMIFQRLSK